MSAPAPTPPSAGVVTYPHLGTLMVATGVGITTFTSAVDGTFPISIKGTLAGIGAGLSAMGLFLLGRSSV